MGQEKKKTGCIGCCAVLLAIALLTLIGGGMLYEAGSAQLETMRPVIIDAMGQVVDGYQGAPFATPEGIALMDQLQSLVKSPESSLSSAILGLSVSNVVRSSNLSLNDEHRALMNDAIEFMEVRPDASLMDVSGFVEKHPDLREMMQRLQGVFAQEGELDANAIGKVLGLPTLPME